MPSQRFSFTQVQREFHPGASGNLGINSGTHSIAPGSERHTDVPCAWPVYLDKVLAESSAPTNIPISFVVALWSLLRPQGGAPKQERPRNFSPVVAN